MYGRSGPQKETAVRTQTVAASGGKLYRLSSKMGLNRVNVERSNENSTVGTYLFHAFGLVAFDSVGRKSTNDLIVARFVLVGQTPT